MMVGAGGHLARCVTASTCVRAAPSCFISRPTCRPPAADAGVDLVEDQRRAPGGRRGLAVVTAMASARRDSSPPEATLASGAGAGDTAGDHAELHRFPARGLGRLVRRQQGHLETAAGHAQLRITASRLRSASLALPRAAWRRAGFARRQASLGAAAQRVQVGGASRPAVLSSRPAAPAARPARGGSGAPATPRPTAAVELGQGSGRVAAVAQVACRIARRPANWPARRAARRPPRLRRRTASRHPARRWQSGQPAVGRRFAIADSAAAPRAPPSSSACPCASRWCSAFSSSHSSAAGPACRPRRSARPGARVHAQRLAARLRASSSAALAAFQACAAPTAPVVDAGLLEQARTGGRHGVRLCQACWPWMSTSCSPASRSWPRWPALPLIQARLLPWRRCVRRSSKAVAGAVKSRPRQPGGSAGGRVELGRRRDLGTTRLAAPSRTSRRIGAAAQRQLQRVDQDGLAAPVSPVSTVKPATQFQVACR